MAHQFEKKLNILIKLYGIFLLVDPTSLLKSLYPSAQGKLCLS
jgi:hypothetical protein